MKDVVINENQLKIAANKISAYGKYLADTTEEYRDILSKIENISIKDELVENKLSFYRASIAPYASNLNEVCSEISSDVAELISQMQEADSFSFPLSFDSILCSVLQYIF